jgi:hypothetical protein
VSTTEQPPQSEKQIPAGTAVSGIFLTIAFFSPLALLDSPPAVQMALPGILFGQLAVLAVWGALGPRSLLVRWPLCLLAGEALFSVVSLSSAVAGHSDIVEYVVGTLLLPTLYLAVQAPVWLLRLITGCRIVRRREGESPPKRSRQFRVRDLLVATTMVALTLGLAQLGLSVPANPRPDAVPDALAQLALVCGFLALWSGFAVLPCVYAAMAAHHCGLGALAIGAYTLAMTFFLLTLLVALQGGLPPGNGGEVFLTLLLMNGGAVSVLFGTLLLARYYDYVLLWPGRDEPPTRPAELVPGEETEMGKGETGEKGNNPFQS